MCAIPDCPNPPARGPHCWGHLKRKQRRKPVHEALAEKYESPWHRFVEATIAYNDCNSEDDRAFERVRDNLRKSAMAYVESVIAKRNRA